MSTGDSLAIIAYLRSLTPINNPIKERIVGFTARNSTGLFSAPAKVTGHIADISSTDKLLYGKYLVNHVARCASCHTLQAGIFSSEKYLAGGQRVTFDDKTIETPGLIGKSNSMNMWSEPQLYEFFKAGIRPDKSIIN